MATKPVHHTLDIYGADLYLAWEPKQWKRLQRKTGLGPKLPTSAGLCSSGVWVPNDGGIHEQVVTIWIDAAMHRSMPELVETCAHEATHAASRLFDHIGQEYTDASEAHAYLVGWLTRWLVKHIPPPA